MPCVKILSKAEYKTYLSDFHELDSNGSGLLEEKEVVILLTKQLGREPPQKMIDDFMRKADRDESGAISLYEYIRWVCGQGWTLEKPGDSSSSSSSDSDDEEIDDVEKEVLWVFGCPYDGEFVRPAHTRFTIKVSELPEHKKTERQWFQWQKLKEKSHKKKKRKERGRWGWRAVKSLCMDAADQETHCQSTYVVKASQIPRTVELCVGDILCVRVNTDNYHGGRWNVIWDDPAGMVSFLGPPEACDPDKGEYCSFAPYWCKAGEGQADLDGDSLEFDVSYKIQAMAEGVASLVVEYPDRGVENPFQAVEYSPLGEYDEFGCVRMLGLSNGRNQFATYSTLSWCDGVLQLNNTTQ